MVGRQGRGGREGGEKGRGGQEKKFCVQNKWRNQLFEDV